jgi:hypothetical protein
MATLAFFFALTGASMAGVKYIAASDVIPASSDLAGSTYGNPLIAADKVTSAKIADGAIISSKFDSSATAPNASKLAGHASSDFPLAVGQGSVTITSAALATGECVTEGGIPPAGANPATDFVLAQPNPIVEVSATGFLRQFEGDSVVVWITACNGANYSASVSGTYRYLILR